MAPDHRRGVALVARLNLAPDDFATFCGIAAIIIPAVRWRMYRSLWKDTSRAGRHKRMRQSFLLLSSPGFVMLALAQLLNLRALGLAGLVVLVISVFGYLALMIIGSVRGEDLVE